VGSAEQARAALAALAEVGAPALLRVRRPDGRTAFYDLASPYVD
jgi:serine protease Do